MHDDRIEMEIHDERLLLMDYQQPDDYDEIILQHFDEQVETEIHDDHV